MYVGYYEINRFKSTMASVYSDLLRWHNPVKYLASGLLLIYKISSKTFYASSVYPKLNNFFPSKISYDLSDINLFVLVLPSISI